jgi:hypothetical protein
MFCTSQPPQFANPRYLAQKQTSKFSCTRFVYSPPIISLMCSSLPLNIQLSNCPSLSKKPDSYKSSDVQRFHGEHGGGPEFYARRLSPCCILQSKRNRSVRFWRPVPDVSVCGHSLSQWRTTIPGTLCKAGHCCLYDSFLWKGNCNSFYLSAYNEKLPFSV